MTAARARLRNRRCAVKISASNSYRRFLPLTSMNDFDFEGLYGVTEERVLNFWACHLEEIFGTSEWSQIRESTGLYLASVLGHFCLQPVDHGHALSPDYNPPDYDFRQYADLTQIAESMLTQMTTAKSPAWMESAGAHILLYAGFFQTQHRARHNIDFFSAIGRDCYLMAAVGKRERIMRMMASGFADYLMHLAELHRHLQERRYLIHPQN